jgi:hypothetical protein
MRKPKGATVGSPLAGAAPGASELTAYGELPESVSVSVRVNSCSFVVQLYGLGRPPAKACRHSKCMHAKAREQSVLSLRRADQPITAGFMTCLAPIHCPSPILWLYCATLPGNMDNPDILDQNPPLIPWDDAINR